MGITYCTWPPGTSTGWRPCPTTLPVVPRASRRHPCYTRRVTTKDVIAHWRKGAKNALRVAGLSHEDGEQEFALFHCHLAVEKAIKAAIMEETGKPHPKLHELFTLAKLLREEWTDEDRELFDALSEFAVAARYDDPAWAEQQARPETVAAWLRRTEAFLSSFRP
jgi:HEPN domain-containing protein